VALKGVTSRQAQMIAELFYRNHGCLKLLQTALLTLAETFLTCFDARGEELAVLVRKRTRTPRTVDNDVSGLAFG
jgi:hypothetical protein